MKKLSLLLALMLSVCSFAACGNNNDSSEEGNSASDSSSRIVKGDDNKDDDDEKSGSFTKGEVEDGVYTNEFAGLTFEIPDGWDVLSDEEIMATMNAGLEVGGSSMDADSVMGTTTYDLVARDSSIGESVMIIFEDLSKYSYEFTPDDYIRLAKTSTEYTLPDIDIDWDLDGKEASLCGEDFKVYSMEAEIEAYGVSMYQEYHIAEKDGYMILVTYSGSSAGEYSDSYTDFFKD